MASRSLVVHAWDGFDMFYSEDGLQKSMTPTTVYYDVDGAVTGGVTDCVRMWIVGPCPW